MSGMFSSKEKAPKKKERKLRIRIEAYDGNKKLFSEEYTVKEGEFLRDKRRKRRKPKSL